MNPPPLRLRRTGDEGFFDRIDGVDVIDIIDGVPPSLFLLRPSGLRRTKGGLRGTR